MVQHVTQIEKDFLLKSAYDSQHPLRFHGLSTAGTGVVTGIDRNALSITLVTTTGGSHFALCEHITGYFDMHGTTYAFDTTIRSVVQNQLIIDNPARLLKSLQRKFVRVRKPVDVHVLLHLANEDIQLDYPVCNEYASVEQHDGRELPFLGKTLQETITKFKEQIREKVSSETIVMFRTRGPTSYEETLVSKTGKILFIPSTTASLPKSDPYPEGRLITEKIEEGFEDPDYFLTGSKFEKLLKEKKAKAITSEIWCPIVYFQYVVGYVYIANSGQHALSFDIGMVDYLWEFTRILAWQLKNTGYFDTSGEIKEPPKHRAEILDMSPGGMLINLPRNEIRMPVKEGSVFSVQISLGQKVVACVAKVTRRFENENSISYGTTFLNLSPEEMINIYEFLYRKQFNSEDPLVYEQKVKKAIPVPPA